MPKKVSVAPDADFQVVVRNGRQAIKVVQKSGSFILCGDMSESGATWLLNELRFGQNARADGLYV